jgi:hypothetical protein
VLRELSRKIKAGGRIYIEFPNVKSLSLPSMKGTLNFCDDFSHVRVYEIREIANQLLSEGYKIIKAGRIRDWRKIMIIPIRILLGFFKPVYGGYFWDLLGFADFVYAKKVVGS